MWGGIGTNLRIFFIAATLSCISQFSFGQFFIGGKKCISVTPPTPPDPLPQGWQPPSVDCNEPTVFFDTEKDATAWQWDFGDPTSGNNTATTRNPRHTYTVPREYTVTLTRTLASGVVETVSRKVTISQPPPQPKFFKKISADTTICDGKTLTLDPYNVLQGGASAPSSATYLWFPNGETTPTIDVTKTGCYSVEVFDATGQCSRTAKINVKFCLQEASSSGGGEKWYFGKGATLSFGLDSTTILPRDTLANGGDLFEEPDSEEDPRYIPVESTESNPVDSPAGVAMVYSPKGELVFYTDGVKIYGKDDQLLPFMLPLDDPDPTNQTLGGTNTSVQSSLIIPKGSCNECPHHLYYVYTQNKDTGLLSYSIVDLRRDNGKGAVVERGIPVSINSTQQIVARKTQDEKGFFIYSHDAKTNEFKVLKVDSTGTTETIQALGLDEFSETGYMRISPEGDKLAMAIVKDGKNYIEVYDLNTETGELTLSMSIDLKVASPPSVYGVEFSQDGEKLYTTLKGNPANGEKSFLYQLNLNLGDPNAIADGKILIDESTTDVFGALQMGPTNAGSGGAIYMAIDGSDRVAYISVPEVVGNASAVGYVPFSGFGAKVIGTSRLGFPNVIHAKKEDEGEGISATFDGTCEGSPTVFKTQGICSPMKSEATWDFGDGTTGAGNEVSHTYAKAGKYYIKMTVKVYSETLLSKNLNSPVINGILGNALKDHCKTFVVEDSVYIKPTPVTNLPDSAFVCVIEGAKTLLDPKAQNTFDPTYRWITSETTPTIFADALGTYTVTVSNNYQSRNGVVSCPVEDKTLVKEGCEPRLFAPEAFSPNGDSINDNFQIHSAHITDFDLKIYNRWGEIIFESFAVDNRWDGKYKGKIMAPMMYAFVVSYKSKYFPYRPKITKTGGVMLIN